MAQLISKDSSVPKKQFSLGSSPITIGRHPECDVFIDDASVSRRHAEVVFENGHYYISDLNSRNGTYLNGQLVPRATKLYDQSEIRICEVLLTFEVAENEKPHELTGTVKPPDAAPLGNPVAQPIFFDDMDQSESQVLSKLEPSSHHSHSTHLVSAEDKLRTLTRVTHALSESLEKDEVLDRVLDILFDLFTDADRGFVILKTPEDRLQTVGAKTRRPSQDEQVRISRTIANEVISNRKPVISLDAAADTRFDKSQSIVDFRIRSIMCAPLINSKDEAIGVIQLDTLKSAIAFNDSDLEMLVTVALQASLAIQKADLFHEAKRNSALKMDLALAHELQQRFLPSRPPQTTDYEFFSYYRPMQQVGGDYFDYVPLSDNRIGVIVADVVGHGIAAALLMAKVSAESRFALATSENAVEAISKMNNNLSGLNIDRFVTLALGMVDLTSGKLTLVNAGHMPPLIRRASGDVEQVCVEEAGLPLGILQDFEYESLELTLAPGDVLVMYTDGINEAMNAQGELLTTVAVIDEIKTSQAKTAQTIGQRICQAMNQHMGQVTAIDDSCLVCVGRKEQAPTS